MMDDMEYITYYYVHI